MKICSYDRFEVTDEDSSAKSTKLATTAASTGLNINKLETKVININHKIDDAINPDEEALEEVDTFLLGSIAGKDGGSDKDIQAGKGKTRTAFLLLKQVWSSKHISTKNKLYLQF